MLYIEIRRSFYYTDYKYRGYNIVPEASIRNVPQANYYIL